MIGGMWRWLWTGSVFGVFILVVGAALESAPPGDGGLPLIEPPAGPIKERMALPAVEEVVPRSSVLNLLDAPDEPARLAAAAEARLDRAIADHASRDRALAAAEAAAPPVSERPVPERREDVAAVGAGRYRIQIAAVRPGEEHDTFDRLKDRYRAVLGDLSPRFQVFSGDTGVLVRVQAGPLAAAAEAEARCRELREAGGECFVVAAPG